MFHVEHYNFFNASLMICSIVASGVSLRTAETALLTFAFVNPSRTSAVVASSTIALFALWNMTGLSAPPPLTILSFNSRMSL